jgi:hypothetical protein
LEKVSYKSLIDEIYLGDHLADGMIGVLPEPEPKEEVRYERVHPHSLDHLLECHTENIESIETDSENRISKVVFNGSHGKVIYEVEY